MESDACRLPRLRISNSRPADIVECESDPLLRAISQRDPRCPHLAGLQRHGRQCPQGGEVGHETLADRAGMPTPAKAWARDTSRRARAALRSGLATTARVATSSMSRGGRGRSGESAAPAAGCRRRHREQDGLVAEIDAPGQRIRCVARAGRKEQQGPHQGRNGRQLQRRIDPAWAGTGRREASGTVPARPGWVPNRSAGCSTCKQHLRRLSLRSGRLSGGVRPRGRLGTAAVARPRGRRPRPPPPLSRTGPRG